MHIARVSRLSRPSWAEATARSSVETEEVPPTISRSSGTAGHVSEGDDRVLLGEVQHLEGGGDVAVEVGDRPVVDAPSISLPVRVVRGHELAAHRREAFEDGVELAELGF